VPVETVFDSGVGELFVVRTAGHVLTAAGLASLRFAMEKLGVRLIVVLGHEDCGAVAAAFEGDAPEWLQPIVRKIDVSLADAACAPHDADDELLAAAVDNHVRDTVRGVRAWICEFSGASGDVGSDDAPLVVGGAYKLASGEVHWLAV
jgi:carbonic anhydrase